MSPFIIKSLNKNNNALSDFGAALINKWYFPINFSSDLMCNVFQARLYGLNWVNLVKVMKNYNAKYVNQPEVQFLNRF